MTKRENPKRRENVEKKKNRRETSRTEYVSKGNRVNTQGYGDNEVVNEDLVLGRNAVIEALKGDRTVEALYVSKGDLEGSAKVALALAKEKNIVVKEVDRRKLDSMSGGLVHQGLIARVTPFKYSEVEHILAYAEKKNEQPFIIILDEIEDPHNLGAIIRSAECAGAHGVIIPKRRSSGLTYVVSKASAGALEYIPIVKVTNISSTIDELKKRGVWIYGADMEGTTWCQTDLSGPVALIIGNEGRGISRLVKEKCDIILSLPLKGNITSLNASVAAGVLMYEISRQKSHTTSLNSWRWFYGS